MIKNVFESVNSQRNGKKIDFMHTHNKNLFFFLNINIQLSIIQDEIEREREREGKLPLHPSPHSFFFLYYQSTTTKPTNNNNNTIYLFALATRSISSFFLMAYELEDPLDALMISSARHSAIVLALRKEASRAPLVIR